MIRNWWVKKRLLMGLGIYSVSVFGCSLVWYRAEHRVCILSPYCPDSKLRAINKRYLKHVPSGQVWALVSWQYGKSRKFDSTSYVQN